MALGINTEAGSPLDLVPIVKYDARAGRFSKVDRSNASGQWETNTTDITQNFKAVVDLENIEVGWMNFNTGGAPDFRMVPLGKDAGPKPSDKHKEGFRIMMKLGKEAGGDVREWCSVAKVAIGAVDELHNKFLESPEKGKLPVVTLKATKAITTGSGQTKSTNYAPVFEVTSWVARPADLVFKPKSNGAAQATPTAGPATTGSTPVQPPLQQAASQAGDVEDFG